MKTERFGFIGVGNMGGALARAACRSADAANVLAADRMQEKAEALAAECGCRTADAEAVAAQADFIFLGAKPQAMSALLAEIHPVLAARQDRFVLVSMAAGLSIARICELAGEEYPVIRIMPNTPAAVGEGMILYTANERVTEEELASFVKGMSGAGRFDRIDEKLIDAASAISGCGPAFVYQFIEALADGGVRYGVPRALAYELAAQTLIGASKMVLETNEHPGRLKDAVCSPGGTTIEGVYALEKGGMRAAVMDALGATIEKTNRLSGK